ncbi:hypothetical protein SC09_contig10orf00016 [Bacillus subtilis]|uniref:Uncharacterized protein n=1 Tax=Bacillus subtilis TaxID=1423 RepID=A0A0D1JBT6_BACIU|nr:hypothetical protein SC09_contig10orf00016 [Bacillus subtilis]
MGRKILIADIFKKEGKEHLCLIENPVDINAVYDEAYQLRKQHKCDLWVRILRLSAETSEIENVMFSYQSHNELDI